GRVVGRLSGIGTLGGITATFGTGIVLVAAIPTSVIVLALAALLAGVSLMLHWRQQFLLVAVLLSGGLVVLAPTPCDVETAYHCARVTVDPRHPSGRTLWL